MGIEFRAFKEQSFDYADYEAKLKAITSIALENITNLQPAANDLEATTNLVPIQAYFKQVEQVLLKLHQESSEEV